MKQKLTIFLAIISLFVLLNFERDKVSLCHDIAQNTETAADAEQSFTQAENYIDLNGRHASRTISTSTNGQHSFQSSEYSKRHTLDTFAGVRFACASQYAERSYSYSCNFPFEHQPQRELYFILRNIRI